MGKIQNLIFLYYITAEPPKPHGYFQEIPGYTPDNVLPREYLYNMKDLERLCFYFWFLTHAIDEHRHFQTNMPIETKILFQFD